MSHSAGSVLLDEPALLDRPLVSPVSYGTEFEDDSPFGLQGLMRETIQILKPEFVVKLAITLALRGTRAQIRDMNFVNRVLSYDKSWVEEYQVVHLIEKSLWIQGRSDLVMTLTRNPSQIPDNPPAKIMQALSRAHTLHPQSTIWYGVPLFGEDKNSDGLPIPVTAAQVRAEAVRRIQAAQQHALRWGWMYRAAMGVARFPSGCWRLAGRIYGRFQYAAGCVKNYWKQARLDARNRTRATIKAELERLRFGSSQTVIPAHTTWLGRGIDATAIALELLAYQTSMVAYAAPFVGSAAAPLAIAHFAPLLFVPVVIMSADPFLFVELPDEPGKLRHLGHWYWQTQSNGRQKLHLHS